MFKSSLFSCFLAIVILFCGCVPLAVPEREAAAAIVVTGNQNSDTAVILRVETTEPNSAQLVQQEDLATDGAAGSGAITQTPPVIEIRSPGGRGAAEIYFGDDSRPNSVQLWFDLDGMEHLRITTSSVSMIAAISSLDSTFVTQEIVMVDAVSADAAQAQATVYEATSEDSPFWLGIRKVVLHEGRVSTAADSDQTNKDGIEVTVPAEIISTAGGKMIIEWIDFYR